jgi:hypothetical protein
MLLLPSVTGRGVHMAPSQALAASWPTVARRSACLKSGAPSPPESMQPCKVPCSDWPTVARAGRRKRSREVEGVKVPCSDWPTVAIHKSCRAGIGARDRAASAPVSRQRLLTSLWEDGGGENRRMRRPGEDGKGSRRASRPSNNNVKRPPMEGGHRPCSPALEITERLSSFWQLTARTHQSGR